MRPFSNNGSTPDPTLVSLQLFRGKEHRPFCLPGNRQTAVLVHGFLGSPNELRPLAAKLHQLGWTVQAILLPGFGADIDTLFGRDWTDWTETVRCTVEDLKRQGRPVLLVGYSLGAAVALNVAAETKVDGLVLLAPFWKFGVWWQRLVWGGFKRIFPRFQPFRRTDFSEPRMKKFLENLMPEVDTADFQIQNTLRNLTIPSRFVDQVAALGQGAKQAAAEIQIPVGIVQGTKDEAVKPEGTRELIGLLNGPVDYEELDTDHDLVEVDNPGFEKMVRFVLYHTMKDNRFVRS